MLKLLFFGRLGELAQSIDPQIELRPQLATPEHIRHWLGSSHPELNKALKQPGVTVAINKSLANWDSALNQSDELAFLPPVSGG